MARSFKVCTDIGDDPKEPWVHIAWKYLYTAKDSWLGATADPGSIGAMYCLTMDPFEKYDMTFNGAAPARTLATPLNTDQALETFVLRWFEQMRTGQIDRSPLSAEYDAHLSDEAIQGMSAHLTRRCSAKAGSVWLIIVADLVPAIRPRALRSGWPAEQGRP